jgi:hypothetical protein
MEQKNVDILLSNIKNKITFGYILKLFIYGLFIYIIFILIISKVNVDNIEIKNEKNLIDFDKKYPLPEKNIRGRNMTKLE